MCDDADRRIAFALREIEALGGGAPDLADAPALDHWRLVRDEESAFLIGIVTGHPRIADGRLTRTSQLVAMNRGRTWARTLSRFYRLYAPADDAG
ncbi:MAG: hypothetical protein DI565_02475 [Ancylobacter novellus]|uniref:Uncharacterized protein n=1 Tax=Ancylobacter novellus TaxID=921 RepID=A0A2W5KSZ3_ANCNO|nr:MAG: hypothetical protein DI565_02475 [Ancylobacter novellus]